MGWVWPPPPSHRKRRNLTPNVNALFSDTFANDMLRYPDRWRHCGRSAHQGPTMSISRAGKAPNSGYPASLAGATMPVCDDHQQAVRCARPGSSRIMVFYQETTQDTRKTTVAPPSNGGRPTIWSSQSMTTIPAIRCMPCNMATASGSTQTPCATSPRTRIDGILSTSFVPEQFTRIDFQSQINASLLQNNDAGLQREVGIAKATSWP